MLSFGLLVVVHLAAFVFALRCRPGRLLIACCFHVHMLLHFAAPFVRSARRPWVHSYYFRLLHRFLSTPAFHAVYPIPHLPHPTKSTVTRDLVFLSPRVRPDPAYVPSMNSSHPNPPRTYLTLFLITLSYLPRYLRPSYGYERRISKFNIHIFPIISYIFSSKTTPFRPSLKYTPFLVPSQLPPSPYEWHSTRTIRFINLSLCLYLNNSEEPDCRTLAH